MATTTPDNIYSPDAGSPYALTSDLALQADSVQDALLTRVQNYRWANSSARDAQTGMRAGDRGYQIDTATEYRYSGAAWKVDTTTTWASFTPTLTGSSSNPTVSGASGRWKVSGGVVTYFFSFMIGASGGSGTYSISLPLNASVALATSAGSVRLYDASTGNAALGCRPAINSASTLGVQYTPTSLGPLDNVGHNAPWVMASGDIIDGFIVYEVA